WIGSRSRAQAVGQVHVTEESIGIRPRPALSLRRHADNGPVDSLEQALGIVCDLGSPGSPAGCRLLLPSRHSLGEVALNQGGNVRSVRQVAMRATCQAFLQVRVKPPQQVLFQGPQ